MLLKTLCVGGEGLGVGGTSEEAFWPHLDLEVPDRVASSGKAYGFENMSPESGEADTSALKKQSWH